MTRRLAERLIGALLAAVFIGAAAVPAHGQASQTPRAEPPPADTTPERREIAPEKSHEQEKPQMQWEEQTLFASIERDDVELRDLRPLAS